MDNKLASSLENLKKAIDNHPLILKLNEIDKRMNVDEEVMRLAYKKDAALSSYEDSLKYFKEDSDEVRQVQKRLHEAKLALDNHPLVKEYNEAYKEVRKLYNHINEVLFGEFR